MTSAKRTKAFNAALRAQLTRRRELQVYLYDDIVTLLEKALMTLDSQLATLPTEYQVWHIQQVQKNIERTLLDLGADAAVKVREGANAAWQAGIDLVDAPLNAGGINLAGRVQAVNVQQLEAIKTFMVERITDINVVAAQKIKEQLGLVVVGVNDPYKARAAIAKHLEGNAASRARTIVNTELSRLYSTANQERMAQAQKAVPGLKKKWRRSNRKDPRASHAAAHGQVQPVDQPFNIGGILMMYPHDPAAPLEEVINCGCIQVPHMDEWPESLAS